MHPCGFGRRLHGLCSLSIGFVTSRLSRNQSCFANASRYDFLSSLTRHINYDDQAVFTDLNLAPVELYPSLRDHLAKDVEIIFSHVRRYLEVGMADRKYDRFPHCDTHPDAIGRVSKLNSIHL